jgi:hypothetical protein
MKGPAKNVRCGHKSACRHRVVMLRLFSFCALYHCASIGAATGPWHRGRPPPPVEPPVFRLYFAAWHAAWSGSASERDWVFALAVFLTLRGESAADLQPFLKPHLSSDLTKALAYLKRNPSPLAALRSQ